jgi:hypothetical protein
MILCNMQQVSTMLPISERDQIRDGWYRIENLEKRTPKTRSTAFRAPSCVLANNFPFRLLGLETYDMKMRNAG